MTEAPPVTPAPARWFRHSRSPGTPVTPAPPPAAPGTPANEGAPVAPAPAAEVRDPAPAEGGSGTPAVVSVPTTTGRRNPARPGKFRHPGFLTTQEWPDHHW